MKGSRFTSQQWLDGLLPEIESARNVLESADRLLRQNGPIDRDLDAIFATYAIGVERLMKLALGTAAVSRGEGWPARMGSTNDGWGHALDKMDERLRQTIRESIDGGTWGHKAMLQRWICVLDTDPVWAAAVRALANYADKGRYHHLDQVAGTTVTSRSSREMWDDVEKVAIDSDDNLRARYERICSEGRLFSEIEPEVRATVADSIKRWVSIVCLVGFHGVLGADWKAIAARVLPDDALAMVCQLPRVCG